MSANDVHGIPAFATLSEWRQFSTGMTLEKCWNLVCLELQSLLPVTPEVGRFDYQDAQVLFYMHQDMVETNNYVILKHRGWMASLQTDNLEYFLVVLLKLEKAYESYQDEELFAQTLTLAREMWRLRQLGDDSLINTRKVLTVGPGNSVGMYRPDLSPSGPNDFEIKVLEKKIDFLGFLIMKTSAHVWRVFVGDGPHKPGRDQRWKDLLRVCGHCVHKRHIYLAAMSVLEYFSSELRPMMPIPNAKPPTALPKSAQPVDGADPAGVGNPKKRAAPNHASGTFETGYMGASYGIPGQGGKTRYANNCPSFW
ncbi:hypothetical protein QC762_604065 [Podospora pseudocomata]|uniref:Uncharacterized protein n=1 Tax=Podospora pseudocomata TaxID=2093779 RepID=A0ABR0G619_9PEZI|nr:hypothetical protein QC762_604065 [Podospora pseudocomata]